MSRSTNALWRLVPLVLVAFGLAACGGGSGGSSSSATTSASAAAGPEAAWAKEVDKVMRGFENRTALAIEQIHTSTSKPRLEPLYREHGADLTKLGDELEATNAPPECAALRKRMGEDAAALGQLTTKLGHEGNVDPEEFSALVAVQETRLHRYGSDLTQITAEPRC
jgi:hypothetical protein